MKRLIIASLVAALAGALCNQWIKHERESPTHKMALDRQLVEVQHVHPDWSDEQIASEVARNATSAQWWLFLIPAVAWCSMAALNPRWWYLLVASVLFITGSVWIGMVPSTVAHQPAAANRTSNTPRPQQQPNTTSTAVIQRPAETSENSTPSLPTRAELLDQIAKLHETPTLTNAVLKDMGTAYGFWIGQNYSIERITKKFPNLRNRFSTAEFVFNRKYQSGLQNIEKIFQARFPTEFADMRSGLFKKLSGVDFSGLNQQTALSFLQELNDRANGPLVSPIYETILEFTPAYLNSPEQEFADGFTKKYSTLNDPAAQGIHLEIRYPASWKAVTADGSGIIQQVVSENGRGLESVNIAITDPGAELKLVGSQSNPKLLSDIYGSTDSIKEFLPPGAMFLEGKSAMVDRQPGGLVYYDLPAKRVDLLVTIRVMQLQTYYHDKVLTFTFAVGTNAGQEQTRPAVFEKFRPVFLLMANSIVLE